MIDEMFKKVIDDYPNEIKKPFKKNSFAKWIKSDLYKEFRKLLNECTFDSSNYETNFIIGQKNWAEFFQIKLFNNKFIYKNKSVIFIFLLFNYKTREIEFGLKINNIDKNFLRNRTKFLQNEIKTNFRYSSKNLHFNRNKIIIKRLKYEEFNFKNIKNNLYNVLEIYEYLIISYSNFLKNEFFEIKDLRLSNNQNIWIINLSKNKESTQEYWDKFMNNSYITTSFIYEHNNIDYKFFKNKSAIIDFFSDEGIGKKLANYIWKFVNLILKDDIILVYEKRCLKGIGVISSNFIGISDEAPINNFYYVNWITILEKDVNFQYGRRKDDLRQLTKQEWNNIIYALSNYNENLLKNISYYIFSSFQEDKDINKLIKDYDEKTEYVNRVWRDLNKKESVGEDISNDIWDNLLPKYKNKHIKLFIQNREKFSDEEMKIVSNLFFDIINKLITENDYEKQKEIIENYVNNKYSSKLRSFKYFNIIHFLKSDFILIDENLIKSIEFFNLIFGIKFKLNKSIQYYIETNNLFHELLFTISNNIHFKKFDFYKFKNFYIFSQWLHIHNNDFMIPIELLNNINGYSNPKENVALSKFYKKSKFEKNNELYINLLKKINNDNEKILEKVIDTNETTKNIESKLDNFTFQFNEFQTLTENKLENAKSDEEIDLIIESHLNKCINNIIEHNQNIQETNYYEVEKTKLFLVFGENAWNKLSDKSKTFLITSKLMYNKLIITEGTIDYSGVCLLVTKAVELEIYNRFFRDFINYLDESYDKDYSKYPTSLLFKNTEPLDHEKFSMGRIAYILCYYNSKSDSYKQINNNKLRLMEYCKSNIFSNYNNEEIEELIEKIASSIEEIRIKYRNPSAHTNQIQRRDAIECFNLIIDVEKILKKMLEVFDK